MTKRVTGIGGVFLKADDPKATNEWYAKHLGIKAGEWGGTFVWRNAEDPEKKGYTAWSIFKSDTKYTNPSTKDAMINYRVKKKEYKLWARWKPTTMENSVGLWIPTGTKLNYGNPSIKYTTAC